MAQERRSGGQAATALMLIIGLFVVGVFGALAFEYERFILSRDQLKTLVDVAALTAETTLASSGDPSDSGNQQAAIQTALNLYQGNSILGKPQTYAVVSSTSNMSPSPQTSSLYFQFLDPTTKQAPQAGSTGTLVQATGAYSYQPMFGTYLSFGQGSTFTAMATSLAGVPTIDMFLVMDISAPLDDQTNVTMVQRYWDYTLTNPHISYFVPSGNGPSNLAQGTLSQMFCQPTYTTINTTKPGNLEKASTLNCPYNFSEATAGSQGLRGVANNGAPPGNYLNTGAPATTPSLGSGSGPIAGNWVGGSFMAGGSAMSGYAPIPSGPTNPNAATVVYGPSQSKLFTDLVVNLDGNTQFSDATASGLEFRNVGMLVEASRGNIDGSGIAQNSGVDLKALGVPSYGNYSNAYFTTAKTLRQPLCTVANSEVSFLNAMAEMADVHFGFAPFNQQIGAGLGATFSNWNVSPVYTPAGDGIFPLGACALNPAAGQTNLSQITSIIPTLDCDGYSNVAIAVKAAKNQINTNSRPGSNRAIVLMVDGIPNVDLAGNFDGAQSTSWSDARKEAKFCYNHGIPIYIVAISTSPNETTAETQIYNDTNSNSATGGLSAIAGHGGQFYPVSWSNASTLQTELQNIFGNIERQMVSIVR